MKSIGMSQIAFLRLLKPILDKLDVITGLTGLTIIVHKGTNTLVRTRIVTIAMIYIPLAKIIINIKCSW